MKNLIMKIINVISICLLMWIILSSANIVCNNFYDEPVYANWNMFEILFPRF